MNCFLNVFYSILVVVPAYVLDYVSFNERYIVSHNKFSRLNLHTLVVLTTYLFIAVFF